MARIRTIKPEFWTHELMSEVPESTALLAIALLNYADDEGYFNANPSLVKAACFPIREPLVSIPESLRRLHAIGFIRLGVTENGRSVGHIINFETHQRVSHATPTKYDAKSIQWRSCDDSARPPENFGSPPEVLRPEMEMEQGKEQGKEEATNVACPEFRESRPPDQQPDEGELLMEFPCAGSPKTWALTASRVDRWGEAYPGVDVVAECRKARSWLLDNPKRRKTARGMPAFLGSWMARTQNRAGPQQAGARPQEKTWFQRYLAGEVDVETEPEEARA